MTAASVIISAAYREPNLTAVGDDPTSLEQTEALAKLNRILNSLFGNEIGEPLYAWPVPPPQTTSPVPAQFPYAPLGITVPSDVWPYPPSNVRLMVSCTAPTTAYLQSNPNDGARVNLVDVKSTSTLTLDGNGRTIGGNLTVAYVANDLPVKLFYRDDLGDWTTLANLAAADELPLPEEFDEFLIIALAIALLPSNGPAASDSTIARYRSGLNKLKARYRQPTLTLGNARDTPRSRQSFWPGTDPWLT